MTRSIARDRALSRRGLNDPDRLEHGKPQVSRGSDGRQGMSAGRGLTVGSRKLPAQRAKSPLASGIAARSVVIRRYPAVIGALPGAISRVKGAWPAPPDGARLRLAGFGPRRASSIVAEAKRRSDAASTVEQGGLDARLAMFCKRTANGALRQGLRRAGRGVPIPASVAQKRETSGARNNPARPPATRACLAEAPLLLCSPAHGPCKGRAA